MRCAGCCCERLHRIGKQQKCNDYTWINNLINQRFMLFFSFSNLFIETFSAENEDMRSFLKGVGWWHNHNIMILEGRTPGTLRPWLHIHSLKKLFFFAKKRDDFHYLQRQLFHWQIVINDDTVVCNYLASWRKLRLSVSVELFVICVFNSCPSRPAGDCLIGVFTV